MTADETQIRQQAVDAILKGVAKKTALIVSVASACTAGLRVDPEDRAALVVPSRERSLRRHARPV